MSKDLEKKQEGKLAQAESLDAWGGQTMDQDDIVVPKILPMQGLSQLVAEGDAKMGEFRDSLTGELLAAEGETLSIIPFHLEKTWLTTDANGEFVGIEPITPANSDRQFEDTDEAGRQVRNFKCMNFYVLLADKMGTGAMPYVVTFRSTSSKAGRKLATMMYMKNRSMNLPPAATVVDLFGKREKNDKGTYIVMDVKESRRSSNEELEEAFNWFKVVQKGAARADHSDVSQGNPEPSASGPEVF